MLQGKKLADVVAEVLDEKAAAELAAERAKVKRVVDQVTSDIKYEQSVLKQQAEAATKTKERLAALNKRLKLLKAGDQGALNASPAETIGQHERHEVWLPVPRGYWVDRKHPIFNYT